MFGAGISLLDRSLKKMGAKNLLIIMSDQHNKKMLGCYGHPVVRTPNLDTIAKRGTLFTDAYTCSPVWPKSIRLRSLSLGSPMNCFINSGSCSKTFSTVWVVRNPS